MTNGFGQQGMQPSLWLPWRQSHDWCPANEQSAQVQRDQRLTFAPLPQTQAKVHLFLTYLNVHESDQRYEMCIMKDTTINTK